jgi:hypothetical protein
MANPPFFGFQHAQKMFGPGFQNGQMPDAIEGLVFDVRLAVRSGSGPFLSFTSSSIINCQLQVAGKQTPLPGGKRQFHPRWAPIIQWDWNGQIGTAAIDQWRCLFNEIFQQAK